MLVPFPGVQGSMSKILPLLAEALRKTGCVVETEPWGRHVEDESLPGKVRSRLLDVVRLRRRLKRERFDVLLVQTSHEWPSLLRDIPLLAVARRSVPATVLEFHGGRADRLGSRGARWFELATALLLQLSDGVLVLSSEERSAFQRFRPSGRFFLVANPFVAPEGDEAPSSPPEKCAGPPTLMFAGRLVEEKGVLDVLSAVSILRDRTPCRLVIAGDGPERLRLIDRAHELGLDDVVELAGYLTPEQLASAYRAADVFVFPSYWAEGFPTVLTEAMCAGLPIVTTRARGSADHLEEDVHALFVPPRDPTALAQSIERLLNDGELRTRMSNANRRKLRDFAPDAVVGAYVHALDEVAAAPRASAARRRS